MQERPPPPVKEAVHAYVSAVQRLLKVRTMQQQCCVAKTLMAAACSRWQTMLLQSQVDALCVSCGISPAVASIARQLWFAHVERLRILEPSFVT